MVTLGVADEMYCVGDHLTGFQWRLGQNMIEIRSLELTLAIMKVVLISRDVAVVTLRRLCFSCGGMRTRNLTSTLDEI